MSTASSPPCSAPSRRSSTSASRTGSPPPNSASTSPYATAAACSPAATGHPACIEAHHRRHRIDGGPTAEHNLDSFCLFHHHQVHEGGWTYKIIDSTTLEFYPPGGGPPIISKRRPLPPTRPQQTPPPRTHRPHPNTPQNIGTDDSRMRPTQRPGRECQIARRLGKSDISSVSRDGGTRSGRYQ